MIGGIALAGGAWIFLAFLIVGFFGIVFGYLTVKGSGITPRSYGKMYGGPPGAPQRKDGRGPPGPPPRRRRIRPRRGLRAHQRLVARHPLVRQPRRPHIHA